jgi:hypothetical protein
MELNPLPSIINSTILDNLRNRSILNTIIVIKSEELYVHLKFLFRYALNAAFEVDSKHGYIPSAEDIDELKNENELICQDF